MVDRPGVLFSRQFDSGPKGLTVKEGSGWTERRKGHVKETEFLRGYDI